MIGNSNRIMLAVTLALVPGLAVLSWFYGWGYLRNLAIALPMAYAADLVCLRLRRQAIRNERASSIASQQSGPFDASILLGTLILALALPPAMPWHVLAVATFGMVVLARQLYGGLGHNIFNPAMVGYVLALVCFPATLALWPPLVDGHTGATALTEFRYRDGRTVAEMFAGNPAFGQYGGHGWEWANLGPSPSGASSPPAWA